MARWNTIAWLVLALPAAINQATDRVIHPEAIEPVGLTPAPAVLRGPVQLLMIALIW